MAAPSYQQIRKQLGLRSQDVKEDIRAQRAYEIIKEATKAFPASVDYVSLIPVVVAQLDVLPRPELIAGVQRRLGADKAAAATAAADPFAPPTPPQTTTAAPAPKRASPFAVTGSLVKEIAGMAPDADSPEFKGEGGQQAYMAAYAEWMNLLGGAVTTQQALAEQSIGAIKLPNGQVIFAGDMSALGPQERAQVEAAREQQRIDTMNAYSKLLGDYGLEEWNNTEKANAANNAILGDEFQDSMDRFNAGMDIAKNGQETAAKRIERILSGQLESRSRANQIEQTEFDNQGLMAPAGKTSFSGDDLGGAVAGLARLAGMASGAPLLNFTGQRTIDPQGQLDLQDQRLGVTGKLPEIPDLGISPDMIPQAPQYGRVSAPPKRALPLPPAMPSMSQFGYAPSATSGMAAEG